MIYCKIYLIFRYVFCSFVDIMSVISLMSIPGLMRESYENLFLVEGSQCVYPKIKVVSEVAGYHVDDILLEGTCFYIYLENQLIARTSDFIVAVALNVALFYIFNLAYPEELISTYVFFQKFLLGITDRTKTSSKVMNLMSKLKKK